MYPLTTRANKGIICEAGLSWSKHKNTLVHLTHCVTQLYSKILCYFSSLLLLGRNLYIRSSCACQWLGWEVDKNPWCFTFQMQHLALWIQEHERDLSTEKMYPMALCQSPLSGTVWRLVVMGFIYELWLLAVSLHLLGYRNCGLRFFQCFRN